MFSDGGLTPVFAAETAAKTVVDAARRSNRPLQGPTCFPPGALDMVAFVASGLDFRASPRRWQRLLTLLHFRFRHAYRAAPASSSPSAPHSACSASPLRS